LKSTNFSGDFAPTLKWRTELFQPNSRYFDEDATAVLSLFMPLPMMARLTQSDRLPPNLQRDVALAVWTRAVLLEDAEIANSIAPIVARYFPQYGAGWRAYQSAATPQQKKTRSRAAAATAARRKSLARFRAGLPLHARPYRAL